MNFVMTKPIFFEPGETLRAARDGDKIVGFNKVREDDRSMIIMSVPGYMVEQEPLDPRTRLPFSVDGVQFWMGR